MATAQPSAARPGISATLGQKDVRYYTHAQGLELTAFNPGQNLSADFRSRHVEVRSGALHRGMELQSYGYGEHLRGVQATAPQASRNRVEYHRGSLVEWYVNGSAGLE